MKLLSSIAKSTDIFVETYKYLQKSERFPQNIIDLKFQWANSILDKLKVDLNIFGTPTEDSSVLFIGNHISYLDIPLLMASVRNVSFVAKQELNYWPIFGEAARRVDTVFVNRKNPSSRSKARTNIQKSLESGYRVALFPSGTTCMQESKLWRKGAFEIAQAMNIWVQPFRITYNPLRTVAYIDRDFFPVHLCNLFSVNKIAAQIEFHDPVKIKNPEVDSRHWQDWSKKLTKGFNEKEH